MIRKTAAKDILKGRAKRTELRVAIRALGDDEAKLSWRTLNGEVERFILGRPRSSPKRVVACFLERRKAAVERADKLARPYGCEAKDILLEQAEFWLEQVLPEHPMLKFAHLHFGGSGSVEDAAEHAELPAAVGMVVSLRRLGLTYRAIERCTGVPRTTAHTHWRRFLQAIEANECVCGSPRCSLNDADRRSAIASHLRNPSSSSGLSRRGLGIGGGGAASVDWFVTYGYPAVKVGELPVFAHRQAWIREHGAVPSEHHVHHADGDIRNNALGNLALLPHWTHRLTHQTR